MSSKYESRAGCPRPLGQDKHCLLAGNISGVHSLLSWLHILRTPGVLSSPQPLGLICLAIWARERPVLGSGAIAGGQQELTVPSVAEHELSIF